MATGAVAAFGTVIKAGDGASPENFTTIASVRNISGVNSTLRTVEVTSHSDTDAEFIPLFHDRGEVTIAMNMIMDNATQNPTAGIINDHDSETLRNFQIVFTDASTSQVDFAAYVTNISQANPHDGEASMSVTLRVSGTVTWS